VRRVALFVLLIPAVAVADAPKLAPHVAPLFEKGKTWTYDTALTVWGGDGVGAPKRVTSREKIACKVVDVTMHAGALVSHVTCDKPSSRKLRIAGFYMGNNAGLWRVGLEDAPTDDDLAAALKEPPLIATKPKVFEKLTKIGGPDPKHDTVIDGLRESPKGGWCLYGDSAGADPDGGRIVECFAPGVGIASGYNDVGGELNKFEYTAR
jgi:hypothetical protein